MVSKKYNYDKLTKDGLTEIIRNIAPSYEYSKNRVRMLLQTLGIEERYLSGFDLAAELRAIANSNAHFYEKNGREEDSRSHGPGRYHNKGSEESRGTERNLGQEAGKDINQES